MKLSVAQMKVLGSVGVIALLWWLGRKAVAAAPLETKTLEIDANVNSPTFGDPINPAVDPEMRRLIDVSNAVIAQDDATTAGSDNQ